MMYCQSALSAVEASHVGEIRRQASQLAVAAGLNDSESGKVSIIATELARNLTRYASRGEMLLRTIEVGGVSGVELVAVDRGPGMANVERCLEDGYSSGGTAGNGLGAVRRLATEFDIFSTQPNGTVVLARVQKGGVRALATFEWGAVNLPAPHEPVCGDVWRISQTNGELSLMIADGLGHGPQAAEAAELAAGVFDGNDVRSPPDLLTTADRRLRGTRGAAVAIAYVNSKQSKMQFAGVGNVAGSLRSRESLLGRGLVSHNGTVGVHMRKVQSFEYDWPRDALLIMHSDGLQSRWSLESYPGLSHRHPAIVAGVLYRDFCRGKDDVTVCAVRFLARNGS